MRDTCVANNPTRSFVPCVRVARHELQTNVGLLLTTPTVKLLSIQKLTECKFVRDLIINVNA